MAAPWGGLNPALLAWRNGVNALFPRRSTRSDGGRADTNHASSSQHQADADGTVDAFDEDRNYLGSSDQDGNATEDRIKAALDADFMADDRWQLIISDRKIRNADIGDGRARDYLGDSPHTEHTHRQVRQSKERDARPWRFTHTRALLEELNMPTPKEYAQAVVKELDLALRDPKAPLRASIGAAVFAHKIQLPATTAFPKVREVTVEVHLEWLGAGEEDTRELVLAAIKELGEHLGNEDPAPES